MANDGEGRQSSKLSKQLKVSNTVLQSGLKKRITDLERSHKDSLHQHNKKVEDLKGELVKIRTKTPPEEYIIDNWEQKSKKNKQAILDEIESRFHCLRRVQRYGKNIGTRGRTRSDSINCTTSIITEIKTADKETNQPYVSEKPSPLNAALDRVSQIRSRPASVSYKEQTTPTDVMGKNWKGGPIPRIIIDRCDSLVYDDSGDDLPP